MAADLTGIALDERSAGRAPDVSGLGDAALSLLLDRSRTGLLALDADSLCVIGANGWARSFLDPSRPIDGKALGDLFLGLSNRQAHALLRRLRQGLIDHLEIDTRLGSEEGSPRTVELRFAYTAEPTPRYLAVVIDTSDRSAPDELLLRRERLRDALAEILSLLTRVDDRLQLYREACRIAVDRAGFRMAWIGLVNEETGDIMPVAAAGDSDGYVENLRLNVKGDARGPGMTVTAIQTGQPVAIADPTTDPMFTTLKSQVLERSFQSAVSLPLIVDKRPIGALTVYGNVVNAFGAIEVELLQHLVDDISFKLEIIGREEARRAVQAERDRLAEVVEQTSETVVITDSDRRIVYTNPAFSRLMGYSPEEVLGRRTDFLAGRSQTPEQGAQLAGAIQQARAWAGSTKSNCKDGSELDLHLAVTPRVSPTGEVIGLIIVGRDVSREKLLESQLAQSQKMEAVGRLAGGIAHDFNNLLTAISGYADMLKIGLPADDPRAQDVGEIQRAAARATQLTGQLLAFSRRQVLSPTALDPRSVVHDITPMLRRLIGEDVELRVDVRPGLGPILADASQLDQVLVNLALNARDAMPSGGRLLIEAYEVSVDEKVAQAHMGARPGSYVVLRVRDTGMGMTPDVLSHAFEPFYTTKGPGKGTGLGLATVLGIVEQSNGYIEVESEPGRGSSFLVHLPKVAVPLPERVQSPVAEPPKSGGGTLLVVEDEAPVRLLACRILRGAGYTVLEARSGEEALDLESKHKGPLNLVFTDVVLPGIGGHELANELKRRRDGVPVLYASGYDEEMIVSRGVLDTNMSYIPKPYSAVDLLGRIGALLSGPEDGQPAE